MSNIIETLKTMANDHEFGYIYVNDDIDENYNIDKKFQIGSQTKMFSSVVILQLVQESKIWLHNSIGEILGDKIHTLKNFKNNDYTKLTIEQLLRHNTGISDYVNLEEKTDDEIFEIINSLDTKEFNFDKMIDLVDTYSTEKTNLPITSLTSKYSNTGYFLLGMIIEEIEKSNLKDIFSKRIFDVLKMKDTGMDKWINGSYMSRKDNVDLDYYFSAGGCTSTISDMNIFIDEITLNKNILLSKEMYEIWNNLALLNPEFGSGLMNFQGLIGHAGQSFGFQSLTFNDVVKNKKLIIYINDSSIQVLILLYGLLY